MKNLYKIEDELYIISNTENISENCWIITEGRLVQVSYLLSNEVAKGNKVILTTNKLLIKDGVQTIPDEFLEWFVKNPSCEEVHVEILKKGIYDEYKYKIVIPKEEPKFVTVNIESAKGEDLGKVTYIPLPNIDYIPKQETLEEAAEKYSENWEETTGLDYENTVPSEVNKLDFINGAKWQAERMYSEEDIIDLIQFLSMNKEFNEYSSVSKETARYFLEQFKKK